MWLLLGSTALLGCFSADGFVPAVRPVVRRRRHRAAARTAHLMKDSSAVNWFKTGDTVTVVADELKKGVNLNGRTGVVTSTWEKCEVDPTCCCAEQVDEGLAVTVTFGLGGAETFEHYFAENELVKTPAPAPALARETDDDAPFDGLSCSAFKMQQLSTGVQAQRLAAFQAGEQAQPDAGVTPPSGDTNESGKISLPAPPSPLEAAYATLYAYDLAHRRGESGEAPASAATT